MGRPINIEIADDTVEFSLTNRQDKSKETIRVTIDIEDYDALVKDSNRWYVNRSSSKHLSLAYRDKNINQTIHLHREILKRYQSVPDFVKHEPRQMVVDHIDRDPLNNSRANLRLVTISENCRNRSLSKTSYPKYRGIGMYFNKKRSLWVAKYRGVFIANNKDLELLKKRIDDRWEEKVKPIIWEGDEYVT